MYVEFLREKWFLVLVSLGGGLGSITWLTTGILLNLNYLIDFRHSTLKLALRNLKDLVFQSFGGDLFRYFLSESDSTIDTDHYLLTDYNQEGIFTQEININLAFDTMHFLLNATIYLYECIIFSRIASDIICGRSNRLDLLNFAISFIGSSFSYGLLFFTFSSFETSLLVYDMVSIFMLSIILAIELYSIMKRYYYKFLHLRQSKSKNKS